MTATIRYVTGSTTADVPLKPMVAGSDGKDSQLIAFDVTIQNTIEVEANANILQWSGAGKIQSIISATLINGNSQKAPYNNLNKITLDSSGKIVNLAVLKDGDIIPPSSVLKLLLVIGNY
jgi:hypothetical protein